MQRLKNQKINDFEQELMSVNAVEHWKRACNNKCTYTHKGLLRGGCYADCNAGAMRRLDRDYEAEEENFHYKDNPYKNHLFSEPIQ